MYFLLFKSIIKNSLTVFLSLYISLLLVEATLIYTDLDRKSLRSDIQKIIKNKKSRTNFDNRDLIEFYLDYKKKIQKQYYQPHPQVLTLI
tara:strand:- start:153 stop:422 length:270 start_codon:yes stop_codon:yes gene_type:complete